MNQTEKRRFLIRALLDEQPRSRRPEIPAVEGGAKEDIAQSVYYPCTARTGSFFG